MSLALQVLQNRMEKPSWGPGWAGLGISRGVEAFPEYVLLSKPTKNPRKNTNPSKTPPNKKAMGNSNNSEDYLYTGTNIYQIKQNSSYFAFTVRHPIMSGNCFSTSHIELLFPNPLHGFRGMLFDSVWMVHRRNNKIPRRFSNKHLLEDFRTLR